MSLGAYIFRKHCRKSDAARDAGLTTPEDVVRYDDIRYGTDRKWQTLDVYRPKAAEGKQLPVIVSIHGGGWVYGDKEVYQFYCMSLAQRGFAVVNFNYRLAPKHKLPAALEDTNSVFSWVKYNAGRYGFDMDRVICIGDSAGAQGAAMYACILTNPEYAKRFSFETPEKMSIKALGLACGLYDVRDRKPCDRRNGYRGVLKGNGTAEELETLSPAAFVTPAFPPCFVFTAVGDFLLDQPAKLTTRLDECGVDYESKVYGSTDDPLGHVFHCNVRSEAAKQANDDQCAFFEKHC